MVIRKTAKNKNKNKKNNCILQNHIGRFGTRKEKQKKKKNYKNSYRYMDTGQYSNLEKELVFLLPP